MVRLVFFRNSIKLLRVNGDEKIFRVLVSDKISKKALDTLQKNNIDFDYKLDCGTSDTLVQVIEPYAGLIIRSASKVSKEVIDREKFAGYR